MNPTIYKVDLAGEERYVLSLLQSTNVFNNGLPNKGIIGFVQDPTAKLTAENIQFNPRFIDLFHSTIKEWVVTTKGIKDEALRQHNGFVYIIDQRERHYPNTRPWDIIGVFPVENGKLIESEYKANPNYQIVSEDGFFKLPEEFISQLILNIT